jgi:hypothetical protein
VVSIDPWLVLKPQDTVDVDDALGLYTLVCIVVVAVAVSYSYIVEVVWK